MDIWHVKNAGIKLLRSRCIDRRSKHFGIDWDGPVSLDKESDSKGVSMPLDVAAPIVPRDLEELKRTYATF